VADTVFYIQKGTVKLTVLSEQGKEAVVRILEPNLPPGDSYPLTIERTVRAGSVLESARRKTAHVDTNVCSLPRSGHI
jgi:CRP-like cAMP-binding protein